MNILLIGSGGREHAMAKSIAKSAHYDQLYVSTGNPGTANVGTNVEISQNDFDGLNQFCRQNNVGMIVVGPEIPLAEGMKDYFDKNGDKDLIFVGPNAQGAKLEASKAFAKQFMKKHGIPTASYIEVTKSNLQEGIEHLQSISGPYVLKADGLAAGKGVLIIDSREEAIDELEKMISGKFGEASDTVVIEQFLHGIEFSVFALTDGKDFVILPEAKDYKRIGEGDKGLNTGGMGAVSPVPFYDEDLKSKVLEQIVRPTIEGIEKDNLDYKGFVFFGLIVVDGDPFVIEYNCRMGDPETEVVFPRIESDIVEAFKAMHDGRLNEYKMQIKNETATTVMLVSGGYPEAYEKGKKITGVDDVVDSIVFHAGTKTQNDELLTNGGRVMALTSFGSDISSAVATSLSNAEKIKFEGKFYRKDIGKDLM